MKLFRALTQSWLVRGLAVLPLLVGLGLAPALPAAAASYGTITVYAPGAAAGAAVDVQFQGAGGNWFAVDGWKAHLDALDTTSEPFKQWTVLPANYGQGTFRWIVFDADGTTVYGISDPFSLPTSDGMNIAKTVVAGMNLAPATTTTTTTTATATPTPVTTTATTAAVISAANVPTLTVTGDSVFGLVCSGVCDHSSISAYVTGLPATTWFEVQWGDGLGNWTTVPGWQGMANTIDSPTGQLFQQWDVIPANFGQGPFRWAAYTMPGGTLMGVSDSFSLPATVGQNQVMVLAH